jgi:acetyl-CoA carboxylase biotin carboxylase subunit
VHLGERDCSIQRRNQKVIEECPSPLLTPSLRKRIGHAAVKLAEAVDYTNAGTMEFLVDQEGHYYFIEMNTRIQVEHTITEEVYGCDLVKEQIHIAAGNKLSPHIAKPMARSHAIQCRINAEDPARNFQPSAGRINFYYAPGGRGIRIDSHAYTGYSVPPNYDSLIAKLIAVGATRKSAIARMRRALGEYLITGIKTTIPFHNAIMRNADFRDGNYDTGFVDRMMNSASFELWPSNGSLRD